MKTLKQVNVVPFFAEYIPDKEVMVVGEIYISREYKTASHLCLCGCGELVVTPLSKGEWALTEKDGKISLSPSIGNYQFKCQSHYIITNNKANFV